MIINIGIPIELEFPYRIKRETTNFLYNDSKPSTTDFWIPGVIRKLLSPGDGYVFCHGLGKRVITPLALVEMPGRRHDRVVYENKWIAPDGIPTKPRVKLCTIAKFRRITTEVPDYGDVYSYDDDDYSHEEGGAK